MSATTCQSGLQACFCTDPATLRTKEDGGAAFIEELYATYGAELVAWCMNLQDVRTRMAAQGYVGDFADREAEILYLLLRHLKPDLVLEISPRHGYSTGHILAALTANGKGMLHSYEITPEVSGRAITDVIQGNLPPGVDASRLKVIVGDATRQDIPAADFALIDSCHEGYFAAWYFDYLVPKVRYAYIHDILVSLGPAGTVMPKAAFLGVREPHMVLQTLAANGQRCFSVAACNKDTAVPHRRLLAERSQAPDRSVLIRGHAQGPLARILHEAEVRLWEAQTKAHAGDRETALSVAQQLDTGDQPLYVRIGAQRLVACLGYRYSHCPAYFPILPVDGTTLTVSELASILELSASALHLDCFNQARRSLCHSPIHPRTTKALISGYRQMLRAGGGVCGLLRHCRHAVAGVARTFTGDRASKEYSGKQRKAGPHRSEGPDA